MVCWLICYQEIDPASVYTPHVGSEATTERPHVQNMHRPPFNTTITWEF